MTDLIKPRLATGEYYYLREGQLEAQGPVGAGELTDLIRNAKISSYDYIFRSDWEFWRRVGEVFNIPHKVEYTGEAGQDPFIVSEAFDYINTHSLKEEELFYIAVQSVPSLKITSAVSLNMPKAIVLTNYRFCIFEKKIAGDPNFDSYPVNFVSTTSRKVKRGKKRGIFTISLNSGNWVEVNRLPADQLEQLVQLSGSILATHSKAKHTNLKPAIIQG